MTARLIEPWVRATSGRVTGFFGRLVNDGLSDFIVTGGDSPFADAVELHDVRVENGRRTMFRLTDGLLVRAGTEVELRPGGLHGMFIGLRQVLSADDRVSFSISTSLGSVPVRDARVRVLHAPMRLRSDEGS